MHTVSFNLALVLDRLSLLAPWCVYGLGCCLLANKLLRISDSLTSGVLVAGWLAVLAILLSVALVRLRSFWYDDDYTRAWLDLRNRAGGAVISGGAVASLKVTPKPVLRPLLANLVLPLMFLAAAALVPAREKAEAFSSVGVKNAVAALSREVEAAAGNNMLPEPDAEHLRRRAEQLSAMAEKDPLAASEALAALARSLDAAMAAQLERHLDALEHAASASATLAAAEGGEGEAEAALGEKTAAMFRSLEQLANGAGGVENLAPELVGAIGQAMADSGAGSLGEMANNPGRVAPENMARLLEAVATAAGELGPSAGSLSSAYSGQAGESGDAGSPGEQGTREGTGMPSGKADGLGASARLQKLSEALSSMSVSALDGLEPGSGGISQGGGPTPLAFGSETPQSGQRFAYEALPEGKGGPLGQTLGIERSLPGGEESQSGESIVRTGAEVRDRIQAGQGTARLGPARARVAARYFDMLDGGSNAR